MQIRLGFILSILVFFQISCFAQVPGFFMKEEKRKVTIPFYSSNSLIIIPVSINGNIPINFLVDTGVRANILFSKNLGDALGLTYTRTINLMGADGTTSLPAFISPINTLDLGPIEGYAQNLLVLEEDFLELEAVIGIPIYGIIGYEFFKNNPVRINYDDGLIDFFKRDAVKWKPPFYHKLDMEIVDEKPYILGRIQQKDGSILNPKLLIDTGANHGILLNRETTDEIKLPPLTIETELGQSLGGVLYGFIGRVTDLKFGGLKMTEVLTSYPEENAYSYIFKESGRQGSLGSEVLGRTRLIFDYPRSRLLVKRGEDFYAPFQFDMSGIVIKKVTNDENRMYISMVREDSPAMEVGILPFDEILSINKIPTFIWEMPEVVKLLRSEENREIQLEIRRYEGMDLTKYEDLQFRIKLKKQI